MLVLRLYASSTLFDVCVRVRVCVCVCASASASASVCVVIAAYTSYDVVDIKAFYCSKYVHAR